MGNKWAIALSAIGAVIVVVVAVNYFLPTPPAPLAVAKRFIGAVEQSDYDAAHELLHTDLRQQQSLSEFTSVAEEHFTIVGEANGRWSTEAESGRAKIEGRLTTENGEEASITFQLVEQNGDWLIVGYRLIGESGIAESGTLQ